MKMSRHRCTLRLSCFFAFCELVGVAEKSIFDSTALSQHHQPNKMWTFLVFCFYSIRSVWSIKHLSLCTCKMRTEISVARFFFVVSFSCFVFRFVTQNEQSKPALDFRNALRCSFAFIVPSRRRQHSNVTVEHLSVISPQQIKKKFQRIRSIQWFVCFFLWFFSSLYVCFLVRFVVSLSFDFIYFFHSFPCLHFVCKAKKCDQKPYSVTDKRRRAKRKRVKKNRYNSFEIRSDQSMNQSKWKTASAYSAMTMRNDSEAYTNRKFPRMRETKNIQTNQSPPNEHTKNDLPMR